MVDMNTIIILTVLMLGVVIYFKRKYTYWRRKGIEFIEPEFFYGNIRKMLKKEISFAEQFREIYEDFKLRGFKYGGVYALFTPLFMPTDPEIIKCILQKDFKNFMNHGMYVNEENDPLTGHLFNLEGQKWKRMRTKLTPTFTSGKMKMMFKTFLACTKGLEALLNDYAIIQDVVDVKNVTSRFTNDIIVSCAFGMDCNSLENPNNKFWLFGKNIFSRNIISQIKRTIVMLLPRAFLIKVGFKLTSHQIESFFMKAIRDIVEHREQTNIERKDFMSLLLQMKNKGFVVDEDTNKVKTEKDQDKEQLTLNELTAQCFVFYLAGFETSATTMTFALYELSINPEIQHRLRNEINSVLNKYDNTITYEAVSEMTYLDKILYETLRKYPPVPGTVRVCNETYTIPGTNTTIDVGTRVHIPIYGIQNDPAYYPEPEVFEPDRFSPENKDKRPPFTYLPFGEGPRICIGLRFGLLQSKVGLITIIKNFKVTINEKTVTPLKFDTRAFIMGAKGGIWLNVTRINSAID